VKHKHPSGKIPQAIANNEVTPFTNEVLKENHGPLYHYENPANHSPSSDQQIGSGKSSKGSKPPPRTLASSAVSNNTEL
jgi:hypothetical protein